MLWLQGGHGALTIGLKNSNKFKSISALSPICHPSDCPWGIKGVPRLCPTHIVQVDVSRRQRDGSSPSAAAAAKGCATQHRAQLILCQPSALRLVSYQASPEKLSVFLVPEVAIPIGLTHAPTCCSWHCYASCMSSGSQVMRDDPWLTRCLARASRTEHGLPGQVCRHSGFDVMSTSRGRHRHSRHRDCMQSRSSQTHAAPSLSRAAQAGPCRC